MSLDVLKIRTAVTPHGKFNFWPTDTIEQAIARGDFWEGWARPWMDRVAPGRTFVDAGACIGFYTIYMALRGVRVHAFEPCPEVFDLLESNVALNGVQGLAQLHPDPLWDRDVRLAKNTECGWVYLEGPDGRMDLDKIENSGQLTLMEGEGSCYDCRGVALDSLMLWNEDLALIKVDAQGADLRILAGARETIERARPSVLCEWERVPAEVHGDYLNDYYRFFENVGYKVVGEFRPDTTGRGDDLCCLAAEPSRPRSD